MVIRIGTMFMGEVDSVGPQSIQTKFFVLGIPLMPLGSFYFTGPGRGIEIPIHGKSVLAGYTRLVLGLGALGLIIRLFVISSWHRDASDWAATAVAVVLAIASLFVLGNLGREEKARRTVLLARTGLAADPGVLPTHVRHDIEKDLRARLHAKELPLRPDALKARASGTIGGGPYRAGEAEIDPAAWGDVYAYARYAAVDDAAWKTALEPIWSNVVA